MVHFAPLSLIHICDEAGHQSNADDVVADLLHQRTDDLVEHALSLIHI